MAKILLVDDDLDIRSFGKKILASVGHDVMTAKDVLEAIDILNTHELDMVISDANMPIHSGFDLLKTLKQEKRFKNLPVALLTARRDREDVENALRLGADDYIVKPIDAALLIRKVDTLFRKLPPKPRASVEFQEVDTHEKANIMLDANVLSVSEVGLIIETTQNIFEGQILHLETTLFDRIGIRPPMLKVLSCENISDFKKWKARLIFVGAHDSTLQKIRAWINAEVIRKRAKAG